MDRITKAVERIRNEQAAGPFESRQPGGDPAIRRIEISRDALRRNRIFIGEDHIDIAQAFKLLRTRIWHQMRANGWHSLGVTSANPGEGKTMTAINLAISLAMMEIGRNVVLIDLDMRRPSIHKRFGFHPEYGVSDFLLAGTPLQQVMVNPGIDRLTIVPGNTSYANSSEILSSGRIPQLFQEIKKYFPSWIVVVDLPPVLVADDVLVVSPHIHSFLLVVEEARTQTKDIGKALELLQSTNLLGTVLNKSPEASDQYYGY